MRYLFMFVHLTKRTKLLVRVRLFNKRTNTNKLPAEWFTNCSQNVCVILFPIAITFYITWWFIHFVDGFFSPFYTLLGINIFGLGFVTSITFIFLVGVFMSSWLGTNLLSLGELIIQKMPFMSYIYAASKQISVAISPG
ncbi:hypothetical protein Hanom_Chr11g00975051 [Helianthus anomalus]